MTSCLTGLDLVIQVNLLFIQHKQSSWIHRTGGQPYSESSPKLVFSAFSIAKVELIKLKLDLNKELLFTKIVLQAII